MQTLRGPLIEEQYQSSFSTPPIHDISTSPLMTIVGDNW
jgi:hypothetical protein